MTAIQVLSVFVLIFYFFLNFGLGRADDELYKKIIVQAYKFLSNEYRTFPLRFQYNLCKGLKYDFAGIQTCIKNCGYMPCPFKKNIRYYLCNCIVDESRFPPFIPTGSFKLQLEAQYKNQIVGRSESYMTIYRPVLPPKRIG